MDVDILHKLYHLHVEQEQGLKVLYQTIQLLNDKNREKIRFEIKNLVNNGQTGTQVLIYIPLDYSYNL